MDSDCLIRKDEVGQSKIELDRERAPTCGQEHLLNGYSLSFIHCLVRK